jgi:hypothetical protein
MKPKWPTLKDRLQHPLKDELVQKVFLFKKSDFVNAKIIIKDN